jgi:hypothetical protein
MRLGLCSGGVAALVFFAPTLARAADDDAKPKTPNDQKQPTPVRNEPSILAPPDPLAISPDIKEKIGSDVDEMPSPATGETERKILPYYQESRGEYRFRTVPPFWFEHVRGLGTKDEDRQSLYSLLYYQRRSARRDTDFLFPLVFRNRLDEDRMTAIGPIVHREAPFAHDNWVTPFVFEGKRKDGGYLHAPLGLLSSHWSSEGAFTVWGPYFRNRTGQDIDAGIVPLWFHGETGDVGSQNTYTLVPPLAFYRRTRELEQSALTVAGPLIVDTDPKRTAIDFAPLFFRIDGHPETGGIRESHTTIFPLFHWGHSDERSLFWLPGYLRRITPDHDTMITPFYSHAISRNGEEGLRFGGPLLPLVFDYRDKRLQSHAWAVAPLYYQSQSKRGSDVLTPFFGRFEDYGVSRTYWVFPSVVHSSGTAGWETDVYPFAFFGRSGASAHNVAAPLYFDFKNPSGRTTIQFPFFWRFATSEGQVTEVAGNTIYLQKPVRGGYDWQTHVAPFFSYGESPTSMFWNVLFGLVGYSKDTEKTVVRVLWLPIQTSGTAAPPPKASAQNR